jgi:hypothetical protein
MGYVQVGIPVGTTGMRWIECFIIVRVDPNRELYSQYRYVLLFKSSCSHSILARLGIDFERISS